jgi:hypothetical protein
MSFLDDDPKLAFELRQALAGAEGEPEPQPDGGFSSFGEYQLVGHGQKTNERCGKFSSFQGCVRTELHDIITLEGKSFKGKAFVRKVFHSCDKPSCPVCYRHGWAVREAGRIESRLKFASQQFFKMRMTHLGTIEHLVASVPVKDYGLSFEALRALAVEALRARGVAGGVVIFHAFRYADHKEALERDVPFGWRWSPHFHFLGFISGGYQCRGCKKSCVGCNGFEARTREVFKKDGFIVKVAEDKWGRKEVRKSIFGTAWYQLNHASIRIGSEHFRVASWFGVCSYRKLKVPPEFLKRSANVCPICQHELIRLRYNGVVRFVGGFRTEREFYPDVAEDGRVVWEVDERKHWEKT